MIRADLLLVLAFMVSPIDLIPDFIPVIGRPTTSFWLRLYCEGAEREQPDAGWGAVVCTVLVITESPILPVSVGTGGDEPQSQCCCSRCCTDFSTQNSPQRYH
jgi:hypothetical protein